MVKEPSININQEVKDFLRTRLKSLYQKKVFFIREEQSLVELGFDSLDRIEMWIDLEEVYHIDIPEAEAQKLITVNDVIKLVEKYGKRQ